MNRRSFIRRSLLWVPVAPAVIHAQVMPTARRIAAPAVGGGGGGGPDTWYYGVGSDNYTNSAGPLGVGDAVGDIVTCTNAGNITKLSVKVGATGQSACDIALYWDDGGTWTLASNTCGDIGSTSTGWNDFTVGTPYAVGDAEDVMVIFQTDGAGNIMYNGATGGFYKFIGDGTLCSTGTISPVDLNEYGVRVYVD